MPPEETITSDTSQSAPEPQVPTAEVSEPPQIPLEPTAEPQTAQIPPSEPMPPKPDPISTAPIAIGHSVRELLAKAREMIQGRKAKKLEKIMVAVNKHGKITNDEVEKLLHVSDATATRYLSALEKENKIKQVGKTGTGVVYSKI